MADERQGVRVATSSQDLDVTVRRLISRRCIASEAMSTPFPVAYGGARAGMAMKVLLISLFHPELIRGGAQQVCYELFRGLQQRPDVEVTLLASVDSSMPALYKSGARITGFDQRPNEYVFLSRNYDYLWHRVSDALLIEAYVEFLQAHRTGCDSFSSFPDAGDRFAHHNAQGTTTGAYCFYVSRVYVDLLRGRPDGSKVR